MGVLPALYYRLVGDDAQVDRLLPINLGFIILCCSTWIILFMSARWEIWQARRSVNSGTAAARSQHAELPQTPRRVGKPPDAHKLQGKWLKCAEESESLDDAMRAMHLNFIMKRAVNFVNKMELEVTDHDFKLSLSSAIPWFKIRETYPWDASPRHHRRRDFRPGQSTGCIAPNGVASVDVRVKWEDPYSAQESCKITLINDTKVVTDTVIHFGTGRVASYKQIFYRAGTERHT